MNQRPPKPKCEIEVIDPDDVLILSINNRWYRSFTSNSDRYPLRVVVPGEFLNAGWNLIMGNYTNVALPGKNDATVDYRVLLDDNEVVHVNYTTEVDPTTFTINFKDTFNLRARQRITGRQSGGGASKRFDQYSQWENTSEDNAPNQRRGGGGHPGRGY